MQSISAPFFLSVLLLLGCAAGQSPPRATWFAIDNGQAPNVTAADMAFLKSIGIQRIYVDVWNNGLVYFKSPSMEKLAPNGTFGGDFLGRMVALAAAQDIEVVAWFEYGFMASYQSANSFSEVARSKGWILGTTSNGFVYCDPANTEVLEFLSSLMIDVLSGYAVRGVELDDHFDCPVEFTSCAVNTMNAAALYVNEHVGWVARLRGMVVCIAPTVSWYALQSFSVDWPYWMRQGWFDEIQVQLYYSTAALYQTNLMQTLGQLPAAWGASIANFSAGIKINGGTTSPWTVVEEIINISESSATNLVVWYSKGILETYPSQFQKLWGTPENII
jgi:uncharacterized lipoprotein YddW (UPF0748 family)